MLVGLTGATILLKAGDEHEFTADEASRLIASGAAVPVSAQKIERAIKTPVRETRKAKT